MTQAPDQAAGPLDDQLTIRLQHQRIIVLGQAVDDPIANRICAQLLLLSAEDPHRDISLYINSPGGSVTAGMAIYDIMQLIPNDVSTLAMGIAASMGQFLLTAGAPGKRFVLPSTEVLLHQGSAGLGGSASDIETQAARLARLNERMLQVTAERTGEPQLAEGQSLAGFDDPLHPGAGQRRDRGGAVVAALASARSPTRPSGSRMPRLPRNAWIPSSLGRPSRYLR